MFGSGPESLFLLGWRGTIRCGETLQPGARELLAFLRRTETPFLVLTNDSGGGPGAHASWSEDVGLALSAGDFLTVSMVAITHLKIHYPGRAVYVVGTRELREEIARAGIHLAPESARRADTSPVVLVGRDPDLEADSIHHAINLVRAGSPLLATHPDPVHPTECGVQADCGALTALLVAATGVRAQVLGKPDPRMVDLALGLRPGSRRERTLVIGCARTDLELAQRAGVAAAVICPEAREAAARMPGARLVVESLPELVHCLEERQERSPVVVEWQQVRDNAEQYF